MIHSPTSWIALTGEFTFGNNVVFHGRTMTDPNRVPTENEPPPSAIGLALCNLLFGEGTISTKVTFSSVDVGTACEVILGYDNRTKNFWSAGIGGGGALVAIRFWNQTTQQTPGWTILAQDGTNASLVPDRPYDLRIRIRGARVTISLDGIEVTSADIPGQVPETASGLFCLGKSNIVVEEFAVDRETPSAFVVMQFTPEYNELYDNVIKPVCSEFGLRAFRADEVSQPGLIIADIAREIAESKLVIAEVTPANPNVYYEVGYAHALRRPTILIADRNTKLPFDLASMRTIFYENTIGGKTRVEQTLRKYLETLTGRPQRGDG